METSRAFTMNRARQIRGGIFRLVHTWWEVSDVHVAIIGYTPRWRPLSKHIPWHVYLAGQGNGHQAYPAAPHSSSGIMASQSHS
jgi:hypothetical protein